jgi:GrpB-like predicted nucleotidyltransferase (UPF0157 family)
VVLLYKSKSPTETDLVVFRNARPRLYSEARHWLADAMVKIHPVTWNTVEIVDYDERWAADFRPVIEHLSFRNRLRNDGEAAAAYVRLKKDLAQRFRNDRERYTEAKSDFIRSFLESP